MTAGALEGLRVLDLSEHVAGPFCTKLLAGFGALVVKVERPGGASPNESRCGWRATRPSTRPG